MIFSDKTDEVVSRFLNAVEAGTMDRAEVFADDVVLDATVPHWRFEVRGREAVRAQFAHWYGRPGTFEELVRSALPNGELVEFLRTSTNDGAPHASHQVHKVLVADGRIVAITMWCGGRWSASLLAEMEAARARH